MFDLQWEKAKVYIYWHSFIASFSVLVIKNTMKIIMIFWVQMLLWALINISRLHRSGKRTQMHRQMMQPAGGEGIKTALLNLSNIYRHPFYLGCWSLVNPWKKASDRNEGKGTKLSASIHHTMLDAFRMAANPHILCWYHILWTEKFSQLKSSICLERA